MRQRVEGPRWNLALAPAFAVASVAALALVWIGLPAPETRPNAAPTVAAAETRPEDGWTQRLLFGDPTNDTLEVNDSEMSLPPEYAAIDNLFFEG